MPVIAMVDTAEEPAVDTGDVAAIVKSTIVNVAVVVWDRVPLVAVIVRE